MGRVAHRTKAPWRAASATATRSRRAGARCRGSCAAWPGPWTRSGGRARATGRTRGPPLRACAAGRRCSPKRSSSTMRSRAVRASSRRSICERRSATLAAASGSTAAWSSIISPRNESSPSPPGASRLTGTRLVRMISRTLSAATPISAAISSGVGSRPLRCSRRRCAASSLFCASTTCTGRRMVRALSDRARVIAWRIHQWARVENLKPRR